MKKNRLNNSFLSASYRPEWAVFALFAAAFAVVSIFHEPWFDEAQSWQIAKCASVRDILFLLPHYEGHPPLWHMLLAIPAKLGVPYEPGLKTVAAVPTLLSVWLILFRSPFPRPVRMLIPFNYFVFYQYGIVSRPYGLMLLAAVLSAMSFSARNEKPFRFTLSLLLLCLCSAYGIVIAGGICICWVFDILAEYGRRLPGSVLTDRRVHALSALLLAALLLIADIMPYPDTYAITFSKTTPFPLRLIYMMFVMLPDCLLTQTFSGIRSLLTLELSLTSLSLAGLLGVLICGLLWVYLKPENRKYYFLPWLFFSFFISVVYGSSHHIGIAALLLLFALWANGSPSPLVSKLLERIAATESDRKALSLLGKTLVGLALIIPFYWTVSASVHDIQQPYFHSRSTAEFLEDTGLIDLNIMAEYVISVPSELSASDMSSSELVPYSFPMIQYQAMDISAYFPENHFYTLNGKADDLAYIVHRSLSPEETAAILEQWRQVGAPDVLLGKVDLEAVFDDGVTLDDYAPVYQMISTSVSIWKDDFVGPDDYNYSYIYLRKDLLDDYGLTPLSVDPFLFGSGIIAD